jgi:hypothetical protein
MINQPFIIKMKSQGFRPIIVSGFLSNTQLENYHRLIKKYDDIVIIFTKLDFIELLVGFDPDITVLTDSLLIMYDDHYKYTNIETIEKVKNIRLYLSRRNEDLICVICYDYKEEMKLCAFCCSYMCIDCCKNIYKCPICRKQLRYNIISQ